jgi:hypothetical protein
MTNPHSQSKTPDERVLHVIDGKTILAKDYNWLERVR